MKISEIAKIMETIGHLLTGVVSVSMAKKRAKRTQATQS